MSSPSRGRPSNPPPAPAAKPGLTVSKVIAGAGAAVTAAVVGSAFGADGTIVGAAVGSVISAVAAVAYERSLDRTRQVVVARVRRPGDPATEVTQVISTEVTQVIPAPPTPGRARVVPPVVPVRSPRRIRLPLLAGATAVIFLIGLLVVTGIELLTGGPVLSSHTEDGTSVGRVLGSGFGSSSTTAAPASSMSSATTPTASSSPTRSDRSDRGAIPTDSPSAAGSAEPSATPAPDGRITATPTVASQSGPGARNR
jgi:hypothetical protein